MNEDTKDKISTITGQTIGSLICAVLVFCGGLLCVGGLALLFRWIIFPVGILFINYSTDIVTWVFEGA